MNCQIIPAHEVPLAEQARVANAAFAGYVGGWHDLDPTSLARFLMLQGTDLFYSRFVRVKGELAGFGYINRTGDVLRLSGMGLIASAGGTGAADRLLEHLLGEATGRGDRSMTLEVIQENPRAFVFYRRHGFVEFDQLLGWRRASGGHAEPDSVGALNEVPILDALGGLKLRDYPDIPWPISRYAIAKAERTRAFECDGACVIISDPGTGPLRVHGLAGSPNEWAKLRALLAAVMSAASDREFFAPPVWPQEFGREVFAPLGFVRESFSQLFMRREL